MKSQPLAACLILGVLLAAGCRKTVRAPVEDEDADGAGELLVPDSGLGAAERQEFYHLSMGSELIPLAWLKVLESAGTGKPFLEQVERFGLLADAKDPDGLPIGLTAARSRDSRFTGRMVGLNCAACHVGEVSYQGKRLRIDGAPSLFDADAFTKDLIGSVTATVRSPAKLLVFLARVLRDGDHGSAVARSRPRAHALLTKFPTLGALREAGEMERALASHLETLLAQEAKRAPADLGKVGQRLRDLVGEVRHGELAKVLAGRPGGGSPLAALETGGERESAVKEWIEHALETVRVLKARVQFARKVVAESKAGLPVTPAGPGRVDDFGLARNLLFDAKDAGPLTAPCSIPPLWGLQDVKWTDWDANTTSSLGRSTATALAGGAVFDPQTYRSTVPPRNLAKLDDLALKIKPPAWPEEVLGKIDRDRARKGAGHFKAHCAKCHGAESAGTLTDALVDRKEIGTDPARLDNYARKLGDREFAGALRDTVARYIDQACKDERIGAAEAKLLQGGRPNQWRTTNGYVARQLAGVWATAPYLHNGSVPTLYDLLLPAKERPRAFPLGQRDFDPVKVGYSTKVDKPRFTFDVSKVGNTNSGHEYGVSLSEDQRLELIEFLKTL
jgi:hypothetical protein